MKMTSMLVLAPFCATVVGAALAHAQACELGWDVSLGNPGLNGEVSCLAVHDDGTGPALYAGGKFTTAGGNPAARIAQWDGGSWSPLGDGLRGTQDEFDAEVLSLISFDDGNGPGLFAAGEFARAGDINDAHSIAVWRDGAWSAVGAGVASSGGSLGTIKSLVAFDDGDGPALYAGGAFLTAGTVDTISLAKWNGTDWAGLGEWLGGRVDSMVVFDDGGGPALFVAGELADPTGGITSVPIAKWTGSTWPRLAGGTPRGDWYNYQPCPIGWFCPLLDPPDGDELAVFDSGRGESLFLTGFFKGARSLDLDSPAQWNGRRWSDMRGGGINGKVVAFATHDDGNGPALYAGGSFATAGMVEANQVARWDGRRWSALGEGVQPSHVSALVSFDDGTGPALYVGGVMESAGGLATQNIARWKCRDKSSRRSRTP